MSISRETYQRKCSMFKHLMVLTSGYNFGTKEESTILRGNLDLVPPVT